MEKIVRKSEFAAICCVTPSRVSQWIGEGKISGAALVGDGRSARIAVGEAVAQLKERLDISQRFGLNGVTTRLDAPPERSDDGALLDTASSSVDTQIKALKLRQAELTTRREEEKDRFARGVYVLAIDAKEASARIYALLLETIDNSLIEIAEAFAEKYRIPASEALALLRSRFNKVRARAL